MFDLKGFDRRIELVLWPLNGRQLKFSSELPAEKSQSDAVKKRRIHSEIHLGVQFKYPQDTLR